MTSKNPAFDKLYKILKLEADTGYRDKAMIGGLSQFAARWQQEAGDGDDVKTDRRHPAHLQRSSTRSIRAAWRSIRSCS